MSSYNPKVVRAWIAEDPDPKTAKEVSDLLALAEDGDCGAEAELADRFQGMLTFGTAGLRGRLGGGPNRMNRAVVIRAAGGLMAFMQNLLPDGYTVVIGHDARHGSRQFALDTAAVVEGHGGHALVFDQALPTPLTAFALRHFNADCAVMVTASHNPPEDNGYKVYLGGRAVKDSGQGAQIVSPFDSQIFAQIQKITSTREVKMVDSGWEILGSEVVSAYLNRLKEITAAGPRDLRIVITSMHGVGGEIMLRALDEAGFSEVYPVDEQQHPDPDFPTVNFPNPEEPGALDLSIALARKVDADIILANDPDADRCSAAIPDPAAPQGWRQLTGNEVGGLLGEQIAKEHAGQGSGHGVEATGAILANSVVSSRLLSQIADKYQLGHRRTLTGFKWISRVPGLIFGYEEAIGYCVDPNYVRDKDGISACLNLAVMAAEQKALHRSLQSILDDQALAFGLHVTAPLSIRVKDLSLIAQGMDNLRLKGISTIAGSAVVTVQDLSEGSPELPPTDGLLYLTEANDQVVVRPSGTEPKLKCYIESIIKIEEGDLVKARAEGADRIERIKTAMRSAIGI